MTDRGAVVVGAGLAGAKTVEALRDAGYDEPVTLIGDETHLPYERPPLSKGYLAGNDERDSFTVHDAGWYDDQRVRLLLGKAVTAVDRARHEVRLVDETAVPYDKLVLATGSRARRLPVPGAGALGVHSLRTVDDCDALSAELENGPRLVVVGGGWIGMEVAATARQRGASVTVVEATALPLGIVLQPEIAQVFVDLHREHDVRFHLGVSVAELTEAGSRVTGVRLADGTTVEADLVLIGIGAAPNVELAAAAGLEVDNGVLVDETLQTSDPDVLAVGDIANHRHPVLGERVRVEHWANALNQPAAAAATLVGRPTPYTELPYFFTDQYDLGMEYVGHAPPGSTTRIVTRGEPSSREFVAFWLDEQDCVRAAMNVNIWDVVDDLKALVLSKRPVDLDRLTNSGLLLSDILQG